MDKKDLTPDLTGDWREMRKALSLAGYGDNINLQNQHSRGTGPAPCEYGAHGKLLYRWSDVEAWAMEMRVRRQRIDLGETALGRWLQERESAFGFATRLQVPYADVCRLIGHRNSLWRERLPPSDVLELISLETDIGVGQLVEDAIEVLHREAAE